MTLELNFGGTVLKKCTSAKFLGVVIDKNLNWTEHGNMILNKISSGIYSMRSIRNLVPKDVLTNIYYVNVQNYLQYAFSVRGPVLNTAIKRKIQQKLKTAGRLLPVNSINKILSYDELLNVELARVSYRYTSYKQNITKKN